MTEDNAKLSEPDFAHGTSLTSVKHSSLLLGTRTIDVNEWTAVPGRGLSPN